MITIDRIEQGDNYWYHFPTIDFKFQNRGRATAFLWQFAIEVLHVEIDQTPILDFRSDVADGILLVRVTNNGWGDAYNCRVQLDEPILNRLFSDSVRQYRGTLQSGETQDIFHLSAATADTQQFQIVRGQFKALPFGYYFERRNPQEQRFGLSLSSIGVSWHCDGSQYKGNTQARERFDGKIILTEFGFERLMNPPIQPYPAGSDTTYGAIIDPSIGPYEKKYSISRKIPPGDVERFHIMVGSSMSCHLQVRFKFFIDQTTVIESETFNISIWNPRDSHWHYNYTDDKNELRRPSRYDRDQTQLDPSVFPLTSDKSHDTHSDLFSHTTVSENDIVQDSLRSQLHRLLRIFRPR